MDGTFTLYYDDAGDIRRPFRERSGQEPGAAGSLRPDVDGPSNPPARSPGSTCWCSARALGSEPDAVWGARVFIER